MTAAAGQGREGSPTYLRIVADVTSSGISQRELGRAVGANLRSVQGWASGASRPSGERMRRLLDVKHIVDELRETYTDEGIQIWLHSRNRNLDHQRPIDLLADGRADEVLQEVDRLSGGMG